MLDRTLGDMEKILSRQDWLVGDKPSLADIAVLPYVISAEKFGLEMMYTEDRPGVTALAQALARAPAYEITAPWTLPESQRAEVMRESREPWTKIKSSRKN